jgi:hypothetical protein
MSLLTLSGIFGAAVVGGALTRFIVRGIGQAVGAIANVSSF